MSIPNEVKAGVEAMPKLSESDIGCLIAPSSVALSKEYLEEISVILKEQCRVIYEAGYRPNECVGIIRLDFQPLMIRLDFQPFMMAMEKKLQEKDKDYGERLWVDCPIEILENHLLAEIQEWLKDKNKSELVDIANLCAMLHTRQVMEILG